MSSESADRRREDRIPVVAAATVTFAETQLVAHAKSINMTSKGVLLRFDEAVKVQVGDRVTCDFLFEPEQGQSLPYWGTGRIVRVNAEDGNVAVQLDLTALLQLDATSIVAPIPVLET